MNISENRASETPAKKADRWIWFLLLTFGVQFLAFTHAMITKNPPRGEAYREQVIRAMVFTFLPFAWSVFLMVMRRTRAETVIAYLSLALSLFELRGMIWLAENLYAA